MAVGLELWFEGLVVGQPANNEGLLKVERGPQPNAVAP